MPFTVQVSNCKAPEHPSLSSSTPPLIYAQLKKKIRGEEREKKTPQPRASPTLPRTGHGVSPRSGHAFYCSWARTKGKEINWLGAPQGETGWPLLPISEGSIRSHISALNSKVTPVPLLPTGQAAGPLGNVPAPQGALFPPQLPLTTPHLPWLAILRIDQSPCHASSDTINPLSRDGAR